jgi:hypothetical protein
MIESYKVTKILAFIPVNIQVIYMIFMWFYDRVNTVSMVLVLLDGIAIYIVGHSEQP